MEFQQQLKIMTRRLLPPSFVPFSLSFSSSLPSHKTLAKLRGNHSLHIPKEVPLVGKIGKWQFWWTWNVRRTWEELQRGCVPKREKVRKWKSGAGSQPERTSKALPSRVPMGPEISRGGLAFLKRLQSAPASWDANRQSLCHFSRRVMRRKLATWLEPKKVI